MPGSWGRGQRFHWGGGIGVVEISSVGRKIQNGGALVPQFLTSNSYLLSKHFIYIYIYVWGVSSKIYPKVDLLRVKLVIITIPTTHKQTTCI